MKYTVTTYDEHGTITEADVVEAISAMEAVREFGAERGWKPEKDTFDDEGSHGEYWVMHESSGARIEVDLLGER